MRKMAAIEAFAPILQVVGEKAMTLQGSSRKEDVELRLLWVAGNVRALLMKRAKFPKEGNT